MDKVLAQIQELRKQVHGLGSSAEDPLQRQVHLEARALLYDLECEADTLTRMHYGVWETLSLDIALRMGLMSALNESDKPLSPSQLASQCKGESLLAHRVARCLESFGCVAATHEENEILYSANKITKLCGTLRGSAYLRWFSEVLTPALVHLPQELEDSGFKCLTTAKNSVFRDLYRKPDATMWDILNADQVAICSKFMPVYNLEHRNWLEIYPAKDRLIDGARTDGETALFVDVGGNNGSQAAAFHEHFSHTPGRIIVQDLEKVVAHALPGIEAMAHDFHNPQPIKGARAYYLSYIMHYYGDDKNVEILSQIVAAMDEGYSKVIINDWVLPQTGASTLMASMDLTMMSLLGGEERSLERHKQYIEAAGFKITGVWDVQDGRTEAVIECEKA